MRYTSPDTESLVTRSYGGICEADVRAAQEILGLNGQHTFLMDEPYLGTGVTKDVEGGIGKMELMTIKDSKGYATYCEIEDGSVIYEIKRGSLNEKIVAIRDEGKWIKVKDD